MERLEARLVELERRVTRQRRALALLGILFVLALGLGATRPRQETPDWRTIDYLRVKALDVINEEGRGVARLGSSDEGHGGLLLRSAKGDLGLSLDWMEDLGGGILVWNQDGAASTILTSDKRGFASLDLGRLLLLGEGQIQLRNEEGGRMVLRAE